MYKILLIDDDLPLRDTLKEILNLYHFDVLAVENGQEALNVIQNYRPHLILCDIVMPIMDGITASITIRSLEDEVKRNIPIIALTANVGENEFRRCLDAGINKVLTKPFEINSLIKVISKEIESYKLKKNTKTEFSV